MFLAFSLLHSNGFIHISQTDISPFQSITRLPHHYSSCTVCLRAQYWGPILFVLYTTPLSNIIANHFVNHQLSADDTQLQKSAPPSEVTNLSKELDACTDYIKTWTTENQLRLNDDKTEAILFPFSSSLRPFTISHPDSITLGSHNIPFLILPGTLFRYPFHPRVTAVARKRPRSFRQRCRWQVTAKHAYTLRMWLCMK